MRVIDISVPNGPDQHVYPGDPAPRVERAKAIAAGDVCNLSLLTMGSHTGTHVDAPYHFIDDGPRLGAVALERMVGEALVLDLRGRDAVDAAALAAVPIRARRHRALPDRQLGALGRARVPARLHLSDARRRAAAGRA